MGDDNGNEVDTFCCASCGVAEVDDVKLVQCDDCDLVRYCSDDCQRYHKARTRKRARKERLNYVMNCYSSNRKVLIVGTAQLCRSTHQVVVLRAASQKWMR